MSARDDDDLALRRSKMPLGLPALFTLPLFQSNQCAMPPNAQELRARQLAVRATRGTAC